jgi:cytochrome c oxidase subunit III
MTDTSSLLREPWQYFERQRGAGKFGIWVFVASEVLFFGALMLTYTVCRIDHPDAFAAAGRETNIWYGTINTAILLTSSLTMEMASQTPQQLFRTTALDVDGQGNAPIDQLGGPNWLMLMHTASPNRRASRS